MSEPIKEILKIDVIKTDYEQYVKSAGHYINGSGTAHPLCAYLFDDKFPEKTFTQDWFRIKTLPKSVKKRVSQQPINQRYELIDEKLFPNLPKVLKKEDVYAGRDSDYNELWIEPYSKLVSLYKFFSDPQPDIFVEIPFELNTICELDNIKEYAGFSYPVQRTNWVSDGFYNLTEKNVHHFTIDEIVFPDILLNARTTFLTSKQSYSIIRKYIQDNINPKYATITSDYDFCFTVKKKIQLPAPIPYQRDISRPRARKPVYTTNYRTSREVEIFEMTSEESKYQGYTPIKGFIGKNLEDLKTNIENYLKTLIAKINEPIIDCPHCQGKGVMLETIKTN